MKNVIHEIRNQLAVAAANVEAFRDGLLQPTSERLGAVLQALADASALLREISLDPQQGPPGLASQPRTIDVCKVITTAVMGLEAAAAERGVGFDVFQCTVHEAQCKSFVGDPLRVAEIVTNVVVNAIRYTPAGGRIEVDCRPSGGVLTMSVTDDGPGIRGDEIGRIFEAGFRGAASADTTGVGVGLSLTKRFVEEHGGTIEVQNVPNHGARFTVRLPGRPVEPAPPTGRDGILSLL
jgi:signal transduction histidine kinase